MASSICLSGKNFGDACEAITLKSCPYDGSGRVVADRFGKAQLNPIIFLEIRVWQYLEQAILTLIEHVWHARNSFW
jgi:hypothetical protein